MAKITYKLYKFDPNKATAGSLCVVLTSEAEPYIKDDKISNVQLNQDNTKLIPTPGFVGTGICRVLPNSRFIITISGSSYTFNSFGNADNDACFIRLAEVQDINTDTGDVVSSSTKTTTTRSASPDPEGDYTWDTEITTGGQITINNLNARDQFAIQALRGILARVDNPSTLSNNEMNFYCNVAYQWAANMMTAAANSRSTLTVDSSGSSTIADNVNYEEVPIPENNTEKYLNNIVYALQRTDAVIGQEPVIVNGEPTGETKKIIAERLTAPNIEEWLDKYKVLYKYRDVEEATNDNWSWDNNIWEKEGYDSVEGEHTNDVAKTLPTWRKVVKVSVVEMPELIQAIKDMTIQIKRIADSNEEIDTFDETFDGSFHPAKTNN